MNVNQSFGLSAVMLLWLAACTGEKSLDPPPTTEAPLPDPIQEAEATPAVPQGLVYDLRGARLSRETSDMYGRLVARAFELADGTQVDIDYEWEGGSNRCIAAKAQVNNKTIASGKLLRVAGNQTEGWRLEVEELQYREDGSVAYSGTSTFALGLTGEKIGDWPQEGRKLYEVFLSWGTLTPGPHF